MIYRVRLPGGDQNHPILQEFLWDDLPAVLKEGRRHVLSSMHKNCVDEEMVCFYSGVPTYLSVGQHRYSPWEVTREHLVAVINEGKGCGGSNIVFAGARLNMKLGHTPLPIKLKIREHLQACEYDRNQPTYETYGVVLELAIELEDSLKLSGKYPWQPHTYDVTDPNYGHVHDFYNDMRKTEEEFLALPPEGRREWVRDFKWRW